ncbi:M23 family metallopeptidase [Faucicola boevrei]|uniref:M23 family metallopeptidase n=2 Tax=Faucicola boevrei TaxID=346665 RepID=UPI00037982B8
MKLALTVLPFVALMTVSVAHADDDGEDYYVGDISSDIQLLSQQAQQKEDRLAVLAQKLSSDNVITITNVYAEPSYAGNGLLPVRPITSKARMSSGFGYRYIFGKTQFHKGMDFAAPVGTPIYATGNGVVTYSGWGSGYGRYIEINHGNGVTTRYAHNSANLVNVGDTVYANQHIANVGNTGRSTGPHLHYEVRQNGQAVNPQTYLALAPER